MSTTAALQPIIEALDRAEVAHMLTGSLASSMHGIARTTADIDLVVDLDSAGLDRLIAHLDPQRHHVPHSFARQAVEQRSSFNVIDEATGWKVDLIVRRDRPFSRMEFARRERAMVAGVPVFVATAEDSVLSKLEWARAGGSDRQLDDAANVLRVRQNLDHSYLREWAGTLGVLDLLEVAFERATA